MTGYMADKYSIKVTNNGNKPWSFCIFQTPPPDALGAQSLAWLATPFNINRGSYITFSWNIQYQIMWAKTGVLTPGVIFSAHDSKEADLISHNLTIFTAPPPALTPPTIGGPIGSFTINDGPTVPLSEYSVAVGIGTKGLYAVNAGPRLQHIFTPNLTYWVCAVDQVIEGQVLNILTLTLKAEVTFPPDVFTMTATLQPDNTWDIKPL